MIRYYTYSLIIQILYTIYSDSPGTICISSAFN